MEFSMKKKSLLIIAFLSLIFLGFSDGAFNSYAGASLSFTPKEKNDEKGIALKLNGVFAGQYTLDNAFILRGHFNVHTDDIFANGLFQDTAAFFTIKEVSTSYRFLTENINQQASLFLGEFESFGSDSFVKKYFGTKNLTSTILLPTLGLDTVGMFKFYGLGLAYSIKLASPTAFGLYFYYNKTEEDVLKTPTSIPDTEVPEEPDSSLPDDTLDDLVNSLPENNDSLTETTKEYVRRLNADLRFSAAWDSLILDADLGISLPLKTQIVYEDESKEPKDVILLIEYAELRAGVSMLIGNNPITNLFLQFGILKYDLNPQAEENKLPLENIYLYMEPRFTTEYLKCHVAFFCLPKTATKNLQFINNSIGCNISFASQPIILFNQNADLGCNFTVSASPEGFADIKADSFDFQISPYMNLYLFGGTFELASVINPTKIKEFEKFISISVGYKAFL